MKAPTIFEKRGRSLMSPSDAYGITYLLWSERGPWTPKQLAFAARERWDVMWGQSYMYITLGRMVERGEVIRLRHGQYIHACHASPEAFVFS